MISKVYESGVNVVLEDVSAGRSIQIPKRNVRYQVSGDEVYISDTQQIISTIVIPLSILVDGSDTPLSTEALVHAEFRPIFGKGGTAGGGGDDGTVTIRDSAAGLLYTVVVASGGSANQSVGNSQIDVNGTLYGTVLAEGTIDVEVVAEDGVTPVGVLDGGKWKINTEEILEAMTTEINFPVDGVLDFDFFDIQFTEYVLTGSKALTLGTTPLSISSITGVVDNTAGGEFVFSADFEVFGSIPTARFLFHAFYDRTSSKVNVLFNEVGEAPPSSIIEVQDDFSVSPLNAYAPRAITEGPSDPPVMSIDTGRLEFTVGAAHPAREDMVEYTSNIPTGDFNVISGEWDVQGTLLKPITALWESSDNRIQIQTASPNYRLLFRVGGVNEYDFTTAVDYATYPRHKAVHDRVNDTCTFYYWDPAAAGGDGAWVQMGQYTGPAVLGSSLHLQLTVSTAAGVSGTMYFDNVSVCNEDYATQFPT